MVVLPALAVLFLTTLPAGVSAREPGDPCPTTPAFYGQSDDTDTWLRLPPYPEGRNVEHVYYGNSTVQVEIHDETTAHNFRIRDLTWNGTRYDRVTGTNGDPTFIGVECWSVPLEVQSGIESGDSITRWSWGPRRHRRHPRPRRRHPGGRRPRRRRHLLRSPT